MRALIQRVSRAHISASNLQNEVISRIGRGMMILVGFEEGDTLVIIEQMAQKIKSLRIFSDASGKMNLAGSEISAQYLVVSQFTLYAECKYGNRPSFDKAAEKTKAKGSYEHFTQTFSRLMGPDRVKHGVFGSDLAVELVNDGPVTLWLDSRDVL